MSNHRNPIKIISNIVPQPLLCLKIGWLNTVATVLKMTRSSVGSISVKFDPCPLSASLVAACSSYIPWFSKISIGFNPQLLMKWGETGETLDVSWCLLGEVPSAEFPQFQVSFREDRRRFSVIGHRLASQRWHSTRKNSLRWHIYNDGLNSELYDRG